MAQGAVAAKVRKVQNSPEWNVRKVGYTVDTLLVLLATITLKEWDLDYFALLMMTS